MDERHISSATDCLCLGYVIINLISLHLPRFCVSSGCSLHFVSVTRGWLYYITKFSWTWKSRWLKRYRGGTPCSILDRETDYPDCDILWLRSSTRWMPGDFLNYATTVSLHSFKFIHCHPVIRVIGLRKFFWVCTVQSVIFVICEIGSCLF
jgi:hypothetical protein